VGVVSITPFLDPKTFDPKTIRILSEAYEAACHQLQDERQPAIVHEVIAERIIKAAKAGERDPIRLRDIAVAAIIPPESK
jgi:hypothetical protein